MSPEEQKTFDEIMAKGRSVADAVKQHRHDESVFAFARELSDNVIGGLSHDDLSASGSGSKSRRLSFKGMGTKVATQMLGVGGTKALAPSGATVVDQEFQADPVALGQVATGLLDVLPVMHTPAPSILFGPEHTNERSESCCTPLIHPGMQGPVT